MHLSDLSERNLMKTKILSLFISGFILFPNCLLCEEIMTGKPVAKINVIDFEVKSNKPELNLVGKGLSALIQAKAFAARDISFTNNRTRDEVLRAKLSALIHAEGDTTGEDKYKLSSCNYILSGNVFDVFKQITISYKLVNATTGASEIQDSISSDLKYYDYITAGIVSSVFNNFEINVPGEISDAINKKAEKPVDALIIFSKGLDFYDKKDYVTAKKEFEEAIKLDPELTIIKSFLEKIEKERIKK